MIRTFIAVNLDPAIKEKIAEAVGDFNMKGLKTVEPELVHITLKFLGNVEEDRIDAIADALKEGVTVEPFTATFRSIGGFPGTKNPRVIWIGAEGPFEALNKQVEDALAGIGFEREGRFNAHVTIGRIKFSTPEQKQRLPLLFEKYRDFYAGTQPVDRIHVMKSTLSPKGPKYEAIREILL
ncbi:2'-5' RNA ligase [Methanocella arvoryzae MRE50]|uniref:RNA 2',3'-cyclic phosphodiesterase n=2 Tax=Methanocella TaxID=570266 RepID=Q0W551_METAR|nr:2'-5' RNA ligase [Methanocella arvoryzae MRE50]